MADLFVSYSREDKARAAEVVRLLEDYGWDVFWDQETRAGELWPKVLEEELGKARCLVALWTTTSIASRWVRIEAYEALQSEKLVPVLLDKVRPPLEFRQTQTFDLTGWNGDREDARLAHLLADLTALAKAPSSRGASRRPHIVVPTTLRRDMPAATLPNAVSAASGEPDAQPATIVPRPPADHGAASSSQVSLSRTGSSRGRDARARRHCRSRCRSVADQRGRFLPGADSGRADEVCADDTGGTLDQRGSAGVCSCAVTVRRAATRHYDNYGRCGYVAAAAGLQTCSQTAAAKVAVVSVPGDRRKVSTDRPDNGDRARPSSQQGVPIMKASMIAIGSLTQASRSLRITLLIASFTFLAGGCSTLPTTAPAPTAVSAPAPAPAAPPPAAPAPVAAPVAPAPPPVLPLEDALLAAANNLFSSASRRSLRRRRKGWS